MPKVSWLARMRQKLELQRRRQTSSERVRTEALEQRSYLSVSTLIVAGNLRVVADSDEAIAVGVNANTGNVQVLVNGTATTGLSPIQPSQLRGISVKAGQGDNLIDLTGVTAANFTFRDPVTGAGLQINVDAGNGQDTVFGSFSFADTLDGGDGDDVINEPNGVYNVGQVIFGGDGDDTITGGIGNDSISAGDGADLVIGGRGSDTILGGDGDDELVGGDGDDSINGNHGEDSVTGGTGNDTILGETGQDSLFGENGNDSILGGGGNDLIFGDLGTAGSSATGDDTVFGNSGDDTIRGGGGADLLLGQTGNDTISVTDASFSVADVSVDEANDGEISTITFVVNLTYELITTATVDVTVESVSAVVNSDVAPLNKTLTFAPGVTSQSVTVSVIGDSFQELNETFRVRLSNAVGASISDPQAIGTIIDNDAAVQSAFDIVINFTGGITPSQQAIFRQAEMRIEQIITGDIPDIAIAGLGLVDDVVINASGIAIDGPLGVLGQAGPTGLRTGSFLPYAGDMQFDTADLAALESAGELDETIVHEMMHVLGFGTIWSNLNLLRNAGTTTPSYVGTAAVAEYNARFGTTGNSVPVEGTAGVGSNDSHWRESVFNNELMTPFLNSGVTNPVSRMTIAQFQDLGYQVNFLSADPFLVATGGANIVAPTSRKVVGRIKTLDVTPVIGAPAAPTQTSTNGQGNWQAFFRSRTNDAATAQLAAAQNASAQDTAKAQASLNAAAARAGLIQTITFDEIPQQTLNGVTLNGVSFGYEINGVDSNAATFGGTSTSTTPFANLAGSKLEGDARGIVTLDFATPISTLSFGVARSIQAPVTAGVQVQLFDANLNPLGTQTVALNVLFSFAEGQYTYTGVPVRRAVLDFTSASAITGGGLFAIDNLTVDTINISSLGSATIMGGDGNDTLSGGEQNDFIGGELGNDLIASGGGNDIIYGGAGTDTAFGGDGDDSVYGQGGNDTLSGGAGNDFVDGGTGNNLVFGDDMLGFRTGNDTIVGGTGNDQVFAGAGDDVVYGGSGNDLLNGEDGNDTLAGQAGTDTLNGGAGDDTLTWRGQADGADFFETEDGQDALAINGTQGNDIFAIGQADGALTITQGTSTLTVKGPDETVGSPIERIDINLFNGDDQVTIGSIDTVGATVLMINGGAGNDRITAAGAAIGNVRLRIHGEDGVDTLTGSAGGDEIDGGLDRDLIRGMNGDDTLNGNDGDDTISGDAGNDVLLGEGGADTLNGNDGDDSLTGGSGSDSLQGGAGNDTASGGAGNDILVGDLGDDLLEGGNDRDSISGNAGNDTLDGGRNDDVLNGGGGNDVMRGDHGNDVLHGREGNDTINGGDGNDTIDGGDGNDGLLAGDGDDFVTAGLGNDTLIGSDGDDTLLGGGGNDVVLGGDGNDAINGNGGSDTIAGGEGVNSIAVDLSDIRDEDFEFTIAQLLALG